MNYLIFLLILIGIIILIMFAEYRNSKNNDKLYEKKLNSEFGNSLRDSDKSSLKNVSGYYSHHIEFGHIDDITWNDMAMDDLFTYINRTQSNLGSEYLYYLLRSPLYDTTKISERRKEIDFWIENPEIRNKISVFLHHIGKTHRDSLYEKLNNFEVEKSNLAKYLICLALLVVSFGASFFIKGYGIILFIAMLIVNCIIYYRDYISVNDNLYIFKQVLNIYEASEKIISIYNQNEQEDKANEIEKYLLNIRSFKKSNGFINNNGGEANMLVAVIKLICVPFFWELIRFERMKKILAENLVSVKELISIIGSIDAYISIASFVYSIKDKICIPEFVEFDSESDNCNICQIYHPLIDGAVSNSIETKNSILLTGANASGKSTFLKTLAIGCILAQTIGYVPAKSYKAPLYFCYSSMSLKDDLNSGDSYYMSEIKAVKRIIDLIGKEFNDTKIHIICFIDELLRGTNTTERIAASCAILDYLNSNKVFVCAATHDRELTSMLPGFDNYHFEESFLDGDIKFSYQLMEGAATTRNAIILLDKQGFNSDITTKAKQLVDNFEKNGIWSV